MMRTAHRQHRSTCRESLVEDIELAGRIAAELEREQRQQYRFAGTSRPYHHHMPDVADMGVEPEWRGTSRLRDQQRRPVEMGVARRTGPHARQRHPMCEMEEIGRASGRERVCQYVEISGGAGSLKKKKK